MVPIGLTRRHGPGRHRPRSSGERPRRLTRRHRLRNVLTRRHELGRHRLISSGERPRKLLTRKHRLRGLMLKGNDCPSTHSRHSTCFPKSLVFSFYSILFHFFLTVRNTCHYCRLRRKRKKAGDTATINQNTAAELAMQAAKNAVDGLLDFFSLDDMYSPPAESRSLEDDIHLASDMRRFMDIRNKTRVCAVCSCRCAAGHSAEEEDDADGDWTETMRISDIPNVHLLSKDGPKSEELPRDSLTTIGGFCLQPLAMRPGEDASEDPHVDVCKSCMSQLQNKKVPMASLVRVDTGSIPDDLLPLTIMEEQLLGLGRACRYIFVMRPRGSDSDMQQWCFRGHVIAFPNVTAEDISACFPMPFSEIPNNMQVGITSLFGTISYFCLSDCMVTEPCPL